MHADHNRTRTLTGVPGLPSVSCMPRNLELRAVSVGQQALHLLSHTYSCWDSSARPHLQHIICHVSSQCTQDKHLLPQLQLPARLRQSWF